MDFSSFYKGIATVLRAEGLIINLTLHISLPWAVSFFLEKIFLFSCILLLKFDERIDLKCSHHTHERITMCNDGFVHLFSYCNHFPMFIYIKTSHCTY